MCPPNHKAKKMTVVEVNQFFTRFSMVGKFESQMFPECSELLEIYRTQTTPLRPQSDSMVERFNHTLVG